MDKELPERFVEWAYFQRVGFVKALSVPNKMDNSRFLLESTRHNPTLCTARLEKEEIILNAKIVGTGFVPKREFIRSAINDMRAHVESGQAISSDAYAKRGVEMLLKILYFQDRAEARRRIDFSKITTLEIAAGLAKSSKHTWTNVQSSRQAVLLYYMPPSLSFEVRGHLEVFIDGAYWEFVNLVHDSFHRASSSSRANRPCYLLNVEEVYDNSATQEGFGIRLV